MSVCKTNNKKSVVNFTTLFLCKYMYIKSQTVNTLSRKKFLVFTEGITGMERKRKKENSGFYIALCCCAVIIAVVGYASRILLSTTEYR